MLGDTITVTLGGTGGTARTLTKINQDQYSSEYLGKSATDELRMKVRHSTQNPPAGAAPQGALAPPVKLDRHNVQIEQRVFPTASFPNGFFRSASLTVLNSASDDEQQVSNVGDALALWASDANFAKLNGWES